MKFLKYLFLVACITAPLALQAISVKSVVGGVAGAVSVAAGVVGQVAGVVAAIV